MSLTGIVLVFVTIFSLFTASLAAQVGDAWLPPPTQELGLREAKVEKGADAEALLWRVHITDELRGSDPETQYKHYMRVKIYTARGVEKHSNVELQAARNIGIRFVKGRTLKPDGTIVELRKDAIHEQVLVKESGRKVKATVFAMPAVEPGAIIEYQWTEFRSNALANYIRISLQREIPVWNLEYLVKPLSLGFSGYSMYTRAFNCQPGGWVDDKLGYSKMAMKDIPAFREEPRMPPEAQVRGWMLIYYSDKEQSNPDKYWKEFGKEAYRGFRQQAKVNGDVKSKAAELTANLASPEEKAIALAEFCRTKIKNIFSVTSGITAEQRSKMKLKEQEPADTLKAGMGTSYQINILFAALATAAGLETRLAKVADSEDVSFSPNSADGYFLSSYDIAVKTGENWRFFDPGSPYQSAGSLRWQEEGQMALVTDSKEPVFVRTPFRTPAETLTRRKANLVLAEDGTLTGKVSVEMTGHSGAFQKALFDEDSEAEREKYLTERLKRRLAGAEAASVRMEGAGDLTKPFRYSYEITVPGYAQRTGRRLFFQPGFFAKGSEPMFAAADRVHDVAFSYGWLEEDTVEIQLPAGYKLENAEAPPGANLGQTGSYQVSIGVTDEQASVVYKRKFEWGREGKLYFPVKSYPVLKQAFDGLHEMDNHLLTLRKE